MLDESTYYISIIAILVYILSKLLLSNKLVFSFKLLLYSFNSTLVIILIYTLNFSIFDFINILILSNNIFILYIFSLLNVYNIYIITSSSFFIRLYFFFFLRLSIILVKLYLIFYYLIVLFSF